VGTGTPSGRGAAPMAASVPPATVRPVLVSATTGRGFGRWWRLMRQRRGNRGRGQHWGQEHP